ncbi:unnamed protein product [Cyprideis torosa]|uniref:Superoxide dismutase [Cu-Zn] n=1 Tax=Cyprideis torosa TaxID=163714 RepID=A0A7R8WMY3_9CRUS|nr:unnamed protein product [Cyprideis torosa]CAG0903382.1 unnamed protein product [Cyprideis torosa]
MGYCRPAAKPAQEPQRHLPAQEPQRHLPAQEPPRHLNPNEEVIFPEARRAVAAIGSGNVHGLVVFKQANPSAPVIVDVDLQGLSPGYHGFHVHQFGDIRDGCKSAAGHFNPFKVTHGAPHDPVHQRHVGDLGNILADDYGRVRVLLEDKLLSLYDPQGHNEPSRNIAGEYLLEDKLLSLYDPQGHNEPSRNIAGRSVVIHAGVDDLGQGVGGAREGSLKTGNAGSRVACAPIVLANPATTA